VRSKTQNAKRKDKTSLDWMAAAFAQEGINAGEE
jgi:hypothetical protein